MDNQEFDYSGLYHTGAGETTGTPENSTNGADAQGAAQEAANASAQQPSAEQQEAVQPPVSATEETQAAVATMNTVAAQQAAASDQTTQAAQQAAYQAAAAASATAAQNAAAQQAVRAARAETTAQAQSYPNVGSSGLNTANTASATSAQATAQQPYTYTAQRNVRADSNMSGTAANNGYTTTVGGSNGGYNGYSYTSAPKQSTRKKSGGLWKKVIAGVCALALCFACGMGGAVVAGKMGWIGNSGAIVVQQAAPSSASEANAAAAEGSAEGKALSTTDVASIVSPSVVVITTEQMVSANTWFGGSYVESGAGSGVVMTQDGYILTCAHVVSGATSIKVSLPNDPDDKTYDATVVGADSTSDIAVIKIEATGLTPAVMGDSDQLAVGESVVAVGNPMGTLGGTVTEGIISAVNREVTVENVDMTLIQTSASISPGNSGGGLFNANGELIGIVNAKSSSNYTEGLGFAVPINTALKTAQELISSGYVKRPVLGIMVITINDAQTAMQYGVSNYGVYVSSVNQGSGAETAGVKAGDRIVSIGDTVVSDGSDVTNYIQKLNVGDEVALQIERGGKLMSFDVTLGEGSNKA